MKNYKIYIIGIFLLSIGTLRAQSGLSAMASKNSAMRTEIASLQTSIQATADSALAIEGLLKAKINQAAGVHSAKNDSIQAVYTRLDAAGKQLSNWLSHYEEPASDQPVAESNKYLANHKKSLLAIGRSLKRNITEALKYTSL